MRLARSQARRVGAAVAVVVGIVVGVVFLTGVARHTRYGSSDNANALLAGAEMFRGNPLLSGWELPANSYWLIDLPVFGLASIVFGVREILLHAVPAAIAVACIVAGTAVATTGRPTRRRWWVGAALLFVLLALPHHYLVLFALQGPHHLATALLCLVAFALLSGARPGDRRWVAAIAVLAVTAHSDPMAVAIGVVPVAAAGVLDAVRARHARALAGPFLAAALAAAGSLALGWVVDVAGGYTLRPDPPMYADGWTENLRATPTILRLLLGVSDANGLTGAASQARYAGAALFALGLLATAVRSLATLVRPPAAEPRTGHRPRPGAGWLDDVLLLGGLGGVATFTLLTRPEHQTLNARYLLPTLLFGAVLTARRSIEATSRIPVPVVAVALVLLAGGYLTTPLATLRAPAPVNPTEAVIEWLDGRGLDRGYGQYWVAGIATATAAGAVTVRPVTAEEGVLEAGTGFASRRWFDERRPFRFVVLDADHPDVDEAGAVASFGPPVERRTFGPYEVLVWDHDLEVPVESPTGREGHPRPDADPVRKEGAPIRSTVPGHAAGR